MSFLNKDAPEPQVQLWAFWEYDQFPFFLSAKVIRFDDDDPKLVHVEGYDGLRFRYFYLAAGTHGQRLHAMGSRLKYEHSVLTRALRASAGNVAYKMLQEAGMPHLNKLRVDGYQGAGYDSIFEKAFALQEVPKPEAPKTEIKVERRSDVGA